MTTLSRSRLPPSGILSVNAGSSSVKLSIFDVSSGLRSDGAIAHGTVSGIGDAPRHRVLDGAGAILTDEALANVTTHEEAFLHVSSWLRHQFPDLQFLAAGHRVVHGGLRFVQPVRVDADVLAGLRELVALAPLHQPHNIAAIEAIARLYPGMPQVVCFDTAFHHGQPAVATTLALPQAFTDAGVRRYGFHGLSYEFIASQLPSVLTQAERRRVVVAHLGSGASMCALLDGRSIATTMGFSALDGLVMGTRPGALDAGVILYLLDRGMSSTAIGDLLWKRSGLLGVSGISGDIQELLAHSEASAARAIELFVYRIVRELGSLAAALGGLDALVFTAGIGEHASQIRTAVCDAATWLGIAIDEAANQANVRWISTAASRVAVLVVPTDEEAIVARHTVTALGLTRPT